MAALQDAQEVFSACLNGKVGKVLKNFSLNHTVLQCTQYPWEVKHAVQYGKLYSATNDPSICGIAIHMPLNSFKALETWKRDSELLSQQVWCDMYGAICMGSRVSSTACNNLVTAIVKVLGLP